MKTFYQTKDRKIFSDEKTALDWEKSLEIKKEYDKMKNEYCKENNIPLIRIPYIHLKELKLEDLLLDTSQFVIKE